MASRCSCGYDGYPTVFGECRTCFPDPNPETVDLFGALLGAIDRARSARREGFTLSPAPIPQPAEHRWEETLAPDEMEN